jgi:hypothetical protein
MSASDTLTWLDKNSLIKQSSIPIQQLLSDCLTAPSSRNHLKIAGRAQSQASEGGSTGKPGPKTFSRALSLFELDCSRTGSEKTYQWRNHEKSP